MKRQDRMIKVFSLLLLLLSTQVFSYELSDEEKKLMAETSQLETQVANQVESNNKQLADLENSNNARAEKIREKAQFKIDNSLSKKRAFYEQICLSYKGTYDASAKRCSFEVSGIRKKDTMKEKITITEFSGVKFECERGTFDKKPKRGCSFSTGRWIDFKLSCFTPSLQTLYEYAKDTSLMPKNEICLWGKNKVNHARRNFIKIATIVGVVVVTAAVTIATVGIATAPAIGLGAAAIGGTVAVGAGAVGGTVVAGNTIIKEQKHVEEERSEEAELEK